MPLTHEYTQRIVRSPCSVAREMNTRGWSSGPSCVSKYVGLTLFLLGNEAISTYSASGCPKLPSQNQGPENSWKWDTN